MHRTIYSKLIYTDSAKPYTLNYPQMRSLLLNKLELVHFISSFLQDTLAISSLVTCRSDY